MTIQRYKGLINHVSFLLFFSFFCCDTSLILRQNALMPSESVARPSFSSFFCYPAERLLWFVVWGLSGAGMWSGAIMQASGTCFRDRRSHRIKLSRACIDFLHFEPPKNEPCLNCLSAFRTVQNRAMPELTFCISNRPKLSRARIAFQHSEHGVS